MQTSRNHVLSDAEAILKRYDDELNAHGLTANSFRAMTDGIRRSLPASQIHLIDRAKAELQPSRRRVAGTSSFSLPIGIRS